MLRKLILILALIVGAFAFTQGPSQATPLAASSQASQAAPAQAEQAQFFYYRRPRYRYYRPRYRYYRPYYGYRRHFNRRRFYRY